MSKLKEIKQRCSQATPGPWRAVIEDQITAAPETEKYSEESDVALAVVRSWDGEPPAARAIANKHFIASARTDLPWAVGWIERASIELRVLRAICRSMPKPRLGEWDWPGIEGRVDKLLSELTGDK